MVEKRFNEKPVSVVKKTTKPAVIVETKTLQKQKSSFFNGDISHGVFLTWVAVITLFTLVNFCLLLAIFFMVSGKNLWM